MAPRLHVSKDRKEHLYPTRTVSQSEIGICASQPIRALHSKLPTVEPSSVYMRGGSAHAVSQSEVRIFGSQPIRALHSRELPEVLDVLPDAAQRHPEDAVHDVHESVLDAHVGSDDARAHVVHHHVRVCWIRRGTSFYCRTLINCVAVFTCVKVALSFLTHVNFFCDPEARVIHV